MEHSPDSNLVTLKPLGFSDTDISRFSSILTLAERGLKKKWTITDDMSADFFLIKEQLIPLMDQYELLKKLPRQQCIFIKRKRDQLNLEGHQLYWGENEVPSLRLLVEFFNQINSDKSNQPNPDQPLAAVSNPHFFDPEQGILGYLLASVSHPRAFRLANQPADMVLYVDAAQNKYYSNTALEQLTPYFSAMDGLQVENLTAQQLQAGVANQQLKALPLSHLLWFTAFTCSQGKVIKGYQKGDIVYLKRWPDINLPGCRQLIKLAAYMQSNTVDLDTVQANTGITIAQIYNFYNACTITNLIGHSQQTDIHEKHLGVEQKRLFARISKRLDRAGN